MWGCCSCGCRRCCYAVASFDRVLSDICGWTCTLIVKHIQFFKVWSEFVQHICLWVARRVVCWIRSFQKSEGLRTSGLETPFHQDSYCQIVSKWRSHDSNYNDVRRTFKMCPSQVSIPSAHVGRDQHFWRDLGNLGKNDVFALCLFESRGVRYHPWWSLMHLQVFHNVLAHNKEHICL